MTAARGAVDAAALQRWIPLLLAIVIAAAFLPALQNGFVDFDDPDNIYDNPAFQGFGWTQLHWMFSTFHMGQYMPLTWFSLAVTHAFSGIEPFGYHAGNLILHIATALLLYTVGRRTIAAALGPGEGAERAGARDAFGPRLGAGLAALLFAIHPLRVESVVWATERRDVLSGMFFVLTILVYLVSLEVPAASRPRWLALAIAVHVLALLSKVVTITLPAVLLILDMYPLRRLPLDPQRWLEPRFRSIFREKAPFALLSIVFALIAPFSQASASALEWTGRYTILERMLVPLFAVAFYMFKTVLPFGLSPIYHLPIQFDPTEMRFLLSAVFALGLSAVLYAGRTRWPALFATWLYYLVVLLPMLGIVQIGIQIAADRFTYLPSLGWAVLAGGGLSLLWRRARAGRLPREMLEAVLVGCAVLVFFLGARTFAQSLVWRDSERLWRHAITLDPGSHQLHNWLGLTLRSNGRNKEAIEEFRKAIAMRENYDGARTNLGNTLVIEGDYKGAVEQFRKAEHYVAENPHAQYNWGYAHFRLGEQDEARRHLETAVELEREMQHAHSLLARIDLEHGRVPEALQHLSLEIYNYQVPLTDVMDLAVDTVPPTKMDEVGDLFTRAIKLQETRDPRGTAVHQIRLSLSRLRQRQGRTAEAASLLIEILEKDPSSVRAHKDLARLCLGASLHRTAQELARAGSSLDAKDEEMAALLKRAAEMDAVRRTELPRQIAAFKRGTADYDDLVGLAGAALEAGRPVEARGAAEAAARRRPGAPEAAWILAILDGSGRDPRALRPPATPSSPPGA